MNTAAPCVILKDAQLAENIGAVARVMANFGLEDLRLVNPRDGWPQERAWASASGADWPLDGAKVFERLEDAIADLRLVLAATARPREASLPVLTPREGARDLRVASAVGWASGLLFGGERAGLEAGDIALCHGILTVPVDPRFHSLNLAQAVAVNAYEWRLTEDAGPPPGFDLAAPPAEQGAVVGLFEQLEFRAGRRRLLPPGRKTPLHGAQSEGSPGSRPSHRPGGAHLSWRGHGAFQRPRTGPRQAGGEKGRGGGGGVNGRAPFLTWARQPAISRAFTPPGSPVGAIAYDG